jgi:hypothetical protein
MRSRSELSLVQPSERLSLDQESKTVVYTDGEEVLKQPLEALSYMFSYPEGVSGPVWSATIDSPVSLELLIAWIPVNYGSARLILFLVHPDEPGLWQSAWVPLPNRTIDYSRLNQEAGFSLYREGNQLALFFPMLEGDQAWEIHLPETVRDPIRFHAFPIEDTTR